MTTSSFDLNEMQSTVDLMEAGDAYDLLVDYDPEWDYLGPDEEDFDGEAP